MTATSQSGVPYYFPNVGKELAAAFERFRSILPARSNRIDLSRMSDHLRRDIGLPREVPGTQADYSKGVIWAHALR